jgi:fatty-acyl-CoA synthase
LNAINTRLDAASVGFILRAQRGKVLIADRDFSALIRKASRGSLPRRSSWTWSTPRQGGTSREHGDGLDRLRGVLRGGDPGLRVEAPRDEWQAIALNYTSGTTGIPRAFV